MYTIVWHLVSKTCVLAEYVLKYMNEISDMILFILDTCIHVMGYLKKKDYCRFEISRWNSS